MEYLLTVLAFGLLITAIALPLALGLVLYDEIIEPRLLRWQLSKDPDSQL